MRAQATKQKPKTEEPSATPTKVRRADRLWDASRLVDPHSQHDKAARVREMFDRIAPTYERVNFISSAGRDRAWRTETVRLAEVKPTDRILDIACGTGNLLEAFSRRGVKEVIGLDFAREMLCHSVGKLQTRAGWCLGDALKLPFADASIDVTSCAFGVRNFQDLHQGLREMYRVLRPGGRLLILEFALPGSSLARKIYLFYLTKVMSQLAHWISGDNTGAYQYLPSSVKTFLSPGKMKDMLAKIGFEDIQVTAKTCGIVFILKAIKSPISHSKVAGSLLQE